MLNIYKTLIAFKQVVKLYHIQVLPWHVSQKWGRVQVENLHSVVVWKFSFTF